jgi:hypothetical protein
LDAALLVAVLAAVLSPFDALIAIAFAALGRVAHDAP